MVSNCFAEMGGIVHFRHPHKPWKIVLNCFNSCERSAKFFGGNLAGLLIVFL